MEYYKDTIAFVAGDKAEEKEERERPWSDLPPELLSLIMSHLFGGDCVNFRLICKSYLSISAADRLPPKDSSLSSQSPYLIFSNDQFFHPIYNITYRMDITKVTRAIIHDSKYGWFLMTQGHSNIFFFNPITMVTIKLPDIPEGDDEVHGFTNMHFSSPPTSLECVVFGFAYMLCEKAGICMIKRNEDSWTVRVFPLEQKFESSECNPILFKGVYYCLGGGGNFTVYDPKKNKCTWTGLDKALSKRLAASYHHSYLVESDGELLSVFVARDGRWVGVFRLNLSSMVLEKLHSLGNQMLFVSWPACFSETSVVTGTGNKIYLPMFHGNDGLFYSLATKKFHTFAGYSVDNFYEEVKAYALSTWIKPIYDTTCVEEFDW